MDVAKPNRRKRSPTEDKQMSYDRDGRNVYGENAKSSRKAIPKFKKTSTRQMRHAAKQIVSRSDEDGVNDERRLAKADRKGLRPSKTKLRDQPLGVVLNRKEERREKPRAERRARKPLAPQEARETRNKRESVRALLKPGSVGPSGRSVKKGKL